MKIEQSKIEIEKRLGFTISNEQFETSKVRATQKLESIICRFGDCNGIRRQTEYITELILEDIIGSVFSTRINEDSPTSLGGERNHLKQD